VTELPCHNPAPILEWLEQGANNLVAWIAIQNFAQVLIGAFLALRGGVPVLHGTSGFLSGMCVLKWGMVCSAKLKQKIGSLENPGFRGFGQYGALLHGTQ